MRQVQSTRRARRLAPSLIAGLLTLAARGAIARGWRSLSPGAVGLSLLSMGLTTSALLTSSRVEGELERAIQTLGPLFTQSTP